MTGRTFVSFILVILALINAALSVTITGFSHPTFTSCGATTGDGGSVIQFRITGTDLAGVVNCTFMETSSNEYFQFTAIVTSDVLCSAVSLEAGTYMVGVSTSSSVVFNNALPDAVITESPIDPANSYGSISSDTYTAGDQIDVDIIPLSSCLTRSKCSDGGTATFSLQVDGVPSAQLIFQEKINDTCKYILDLTTKGVYDYRILFNQTTLLTNGTIGITTGISSINSTNSYVTASNITSVSSSKTACFQVSLMDSYSNSIEELEANQFDLSWKGMSGTIVEEVFMADSGNGNYTLCFTPSKSGNLQLEVKVGGSELKNSPVSVSVAAGLFEASNSLIRDGSLCPSNCAETSVSAVVAGVTGTFVIITKDFYGNTKTDNSDVDTQLFSGSLVGKTDSYDMSAKVQGQYVIFSYNATKIGSYSVVIKYNGVDLDQGRSPTVVVSSNSINFGYCTFQQTGSNTIAAGSNIITSVTAFDGYGNQILGDTKWTAKIVPSSGASLNCPVLQVQSTNEYRATCNATIAKSYTIYFYHDGVQFPQTRSVTITPAGVFAQRSLFGGYSLQMAAGATSKVYITTFDRYGNPGGSILSYQKFLIQIQLEVNGKVIERFVTDSVTKTNGKDNEYTSDFSLTVAGDYVITVLFSGISLIAQQSRTISISPDVTKGPYCTLTIKNEPVAATTVWFELQAKDQYNNLQIVDEKSDFSVVAKLAGDTISFNCDIALTNTLGVYNVSFVPTKAGQYQFFGLYKNSEPFSVTVPVIVVAGPISPSQTGFATGSTGQTQSEAGAKSLILIQGRDAANNRVTINPNEPEDNYLVVLTLQSKKRESIEITAQKENSTEAQLLNGISVYSYVAKVAGTYTVSITKNGAHISGSPSSLVVSSSSNYDTTFQITGPNSMKVGESTSFTLTISDIYGNPVDGKDSVDADMIGVDNGVISRLQPSFSLGKYVFPFQAEVGGRYNLFITWNNVPLPNTPVLDVFSNDGGKCTKFDGPINQGQKWELSCIAFDDYGKEQKAGGASVSIKAPHASFTVVDKGDGSYIVTYSSQRIGKKTVEISINGKLLRDMPYSVTIIPGALVLGTVIPSMFIFGLILVAAFVYYRKRKQKQELLLKKRRKPQQVFEVGDYEEEWSDEDENGEQEENWFGSNMDKEEKLKVAHDLTIKSLAQD